MSDTQKEIKENDGYQLQVKVIEAMIQNSKRTGFESVTTHALTVISRRYKGLLGLVKQKDAEIEKLREIQRALVLTPMQKMSRAMEIIDKQKGADTCAP